MRKMCLILSGFFLPILTLAATSSVYCPAGAQYIQLGMSSMQVKNACGNPLSRQKMNQPASKKVAMDQLIYNNEGDSQAFYGVWSLPIGHSNKGLLQPFNGESGGGARISVNVVDNKIRNIYLNNQSTNAFSICGGRSVAVGDPVSMVYNACGTPSLINHSFIYEAIPSNTPPEIWVYQLSPYQPTLSLTFIDGKLQSIN